MNKIIGIFVIFVLVGYISSYSQLVEQYDFSIGTYPTGDSALNYKISTTDLIQGLIGTIAAGSFHPVTLPSDNNDRLATLTDGNFASAGVTVIANDYGSLGGPPGDSNPSLVIEYSLASASSVGAIAVFSGHDANGDRGWINVRVELDTGSGYTTYIENLKTGPYGQSKPNDSSVGVVRLVDRSGIIAENVSQIRLSFFNVSHVSTGTFKAPDDNSAPENNFPIQGTILKEIDIDGPQPPIPATAPIWNFYSD